MGISAVVVAGVSAGVSALDSANNVEEASQEAARTANPFGNYRQQYGEQLSRLMANPEEELARTPGYKAGLDAIQRAGAAQGFTGSGNMAVALLDYGGNIFNQQVQTLSQLAGAQFDPANSGKFIMEGAENKANLHNSALSQFSGAAGAFFDW